jgi:hypothetical protein
MRFSSTGGFKSSSPPRISLLYNITYNILSNNLGGLLAMKN